MRRCCMSTLRRPLLTRFRNHDARSFARPPGLRSVHDRLAVLSVRVPPLMERPVVKELALAAVRRGIRSGVRKLGAEQVHALVIPNLEPLYGSAGERHRVLYVKDDYVAGAELTGLPSRRLHRLSERLPREADTVVAVSQVLADGLRSSGIEPLLIPNGVDVRVFKDAGVPSASGDAPPVTAFVGHLSERVDVRLLTAVADRGVRVRMIGPPQETMQEGHLGPLQAHPNVEWAGRVAYSQLGRGALGRHHVCPALRRHGLQPRELPTEDPRVPCSWSEGRVHGPARRAVAGHPSRRPGRQRRGFRRRRRAVACIAADGGRDRRAPGLRRDAQLGSEDASAGRSPRARRAGNGSG